MANSNFEIGDLVWAKMKSYPSWPGRVAKPPNANKKGQQYIYFFGTKNHSWIKNDNIEFHSENLLKKVNPNIKLHGYVEAIDEIKNEFQKKGKPRKSINEDKQKPLTEKPRKSLNVDKQKPVSEKPSKVLKTKKIVAKQNETNIKPIPAKKSTTPVKKSPAKVLKKQNLSSENKYESNQVEKLNTSAEKSSNQVSKKQKLSNENEDTPVDGIIKSKGILMELFENALNGTSVESDEDVAVLEMDVEPTLQQIAILQDNFEKSFVTNKKIGFLGLGMMGRGMVKNLLKAGHQVMVWNRTLDKCKAFEEKGASKGSTVAEVVKQCDITFCCVADPEAVRQVVLGKDGVLKGFEGFPLGAKGYVEMSSVDAETSEKMASEIVDAGMNYLEAPIIGNRMNAEDGSLLILGAGNRSLFNDCESCFHAMANHAYYISCHVGKSAHINIITSTFVGVTQAALAEVMAEAKSLNYDQHELLKVFKLRGLLGKSTEESGSAILHRNFTADTYLKHQEKDMNLGINLSDKLNQPLPIASFAHETYVRAKMMGLGNIDSTGVYLTYDEDVRDSP